MTKLLTQKEQDRFKAHKLHQQGRSDKYISGRLKKSLKWVQRSRKRFEELGDFKDRLRTGRSKKVIPRDHARLVKMVKGKERRSTRKVAASFRTSKNESISRETVRLNLKKSKLYPHRKGKTPHLTPRQKEKRVAFATKYRRYDWKNCAFWDETEHELYPTPNIKNDIIWDERGAEYRYGKSAHPPTFRYGVAITPYGPTRIVPYTGNINALQYQNMVDQVVRDVDKLFGHHNWTWVQDGARPHTARSTLDHFKKVLPDVIPPKDWPPNSPDDNPAENTFGFVDSEVQAKGSKTLRALEVNVRNVWKKVTPDFCRKCIEVLPKRLKQIIAKKGEYVYGLNASP